MRPQELFNAAVAQHQAGNAGQAERLYRRVLDEVPNHGPSLQYLGMLLQGTGRREEAADLLLRATQSDPRDAAAHNNLANLLRELGRRDEAIAEYEAALRLDPDYVNAQHNLASLLLQSGAPAEAARWYRRVVRADPSDAEALSALGIALSAVGDLDEALECFRSSVSLQPSDPRAHYNLGNALKKLDRLEFALEAYGHAVDLRPAYAEAHNNIGMVLTAQGKTAAAIEAFEEAVRCAPGYARALLNLAAARLEGGEHEAAAEACRAALALVPMDADAHANMGAILAGLGQWRDSEAAYRRALELEDEHRKALQGLGGALLELQRGEEAARCFERILAQDPDHAEARYGLGRALELLHRLGEAIASYRAVSALAPIYAAAQQNLGNCLHNQGRYEAALEAFERALTAKPTHTAAHESILFSSNYIPGTDPAALFEQHRAWAGRHAGHLGGGVSSEKVGRDPSRRLRVGYISPDFRFHSVAFFVDALLGAHDRDGFEVTCYSDVARRDAYTERLEKLSDRWRGIRGLDDERVLELIREDEIDILVELAGHTAENRLLLLARRPAPVQVSYLGYPNTTGLEQVDYRVSDAWADPPGLSDRLHSENLVRLPSGFLCYRPWSDEPAVSDPPVDRRGYVTFGSFNNTAKVNAGVVSVWADILRTLPDARLVLKYKYLSDEEARADLLASFDHNGVQKDRLALVGELSPRQTHLEAYHGIDIALDPFPYNGTTTTCEAMWMGVPVVTLAGEVHRSRVGVSLLNQVGLTEFIADAPEQFVQVAVSLAKDRQRLTRLRSELRARMAGSPLMDATQTVRELEKEYREMWRRFCAQSAHSANESTPKPR